ncbi:MAG: CPBP family intramembrane glutamic endopeptidase [Candidatus Krumholzibacteriota bacterium]
MPTEPSIVVKSPERDARCAWVILVAMIALTQFYYWTRADTIGVTTVGRDWMEMTRQPLSLVQHNLAAGLILGVLPLLCARKLCGLGLRDFGLGFGRPKRGLVWLAVGIPVAILAAKLSSLQPEMRAVYPLDPHLTAAPGPFARHAGLQFIYYSAWEILFRGILLYGLKDRFGFAAANIIQTALSVVAHFGRPFTETASAIPAGLAFGGVVRHTGSVWYVVIIHWVVGAAQDWFIIR